MTAHMDCGPSGAIFGTFIVYIYIYYCMHIGTTMSAITLIILLSNDFILYRSYTTFGYR